jgi:hypothetical protein
MPRQVTHLLLNEYDEHHIPDHFHNIISPEQRLLWSILERGISDAIGLTGSIADTSHFVQDAYHWIMYSKPVTEYFEFSFEGICEQLDLSAPTIRKFVIIEARKPRSEKVARHRRRVQPYNPYKKRKTNGNQISYIEKTSR